ncbi:thioredoxin-like [Centroberyx gerrardi]|uniref:thioredoxin-like n=1 Tax=Centroberyx gerrardi TaxID=166262 RepID=UPI003AAF18BB
MYTVIETEADFKKALADAGDKLVVVDFTASWCGPCQKIAPKFKTLSEEHTDCVFLKIDVDDAADVAAACNIQSMPTFQFYKKGNKVGEFSGANDSKLEQMVKSLK